jgi:hypothetical protein
MRALKAVRVAVLLAAIPAPGAGQTRVTGTHLSALPALNYNSDEGFGYGLVGGVYAYGDGTRDPYRWAVEPLLFFTTNGRRQVRVYVDLPYVRDRLRLTVLGAWDRDCCYPYYGLGNATPYDPALAAPDSGPSFYSYRRERVSGEADVQWRAWRGVRVLVGFAAHRNAATSRAPDTRFALDSLAGVITGEATAVSAGLKVGLVLDTRDQERDPTRGIWADALLWRGLEPLGSATTFTRLTGTVRVYAPVRDDLTVAARALGESVWGDMPLAMLPDLASSDRDIAEFGGSRTVRGVFRGRLLAPRRAFGNLEMRWRAGRFRLVGQSFRPGAVLFVDGGRVWGEGEAFALTGLAWGTGAGARLAWGEAFIIALDVAYGEEAGVQYYLDIGHLF